MKMLLICCFALILAGCGATESGSGRSKGECPNQISYEVAILIAKGYMFPDYDPRDYDIEATEQPEGWRVQYTLKCVGCEGGNPYILVDKNSGQVIRLFHSK